MAVLETQLVESATVSRDTGVDVVQIVSAQANRNKAGFKRDGTWSLVEELLHAVRRKRISDLTKT